MTRRRLLLISTTILLLVVLFVPVAEAGPPSMVAGGGSAYDLLSLSPLEESTMKFSVNARVTGPDGQADGQLRVRFEDGYLSPVEVVAEVETLVPDYSTPTEANASCVVTAASEATGIDVGLVFQVKLVDVGSDTTSSDLILFCGLPINAPSNWVVDTGNIRIN